MKEPPPLLLSLLSNNGATTTGSREAGNAVCSVSRLSVLPTPRVPIVHPATTCIMMQGGGCDGNQCSVIERTRSRQSARGFVRSFAEMEARAERAGIVRCGRCIRYDLRAVERFLKQNSSINQKAVDRRSAAHSEVHLAHATDRV